MPGTVRIKIHEFMERRGMNASDLMHACHLAYGTASRLTKGEAESISFEVIAKLCDYFECSPGDLFEYTPPKVKTK